MPVAWSTRYWSCRRAGAAAASRRVLNDRSALRTAPGAHAPKSAASSWSGPSKAFAVEAYRFTDPTTRPASWMGRDRLLATPWAALARANSCHLCSSRASMAATSTVSPSWAASTQGPPSRYCIASMEATTSEVATRVRVTPCSRMLAEPDAVGHGVDRQLPGAGQGRGQIKVVGRREVAQRLLGLRQRLQLGRLHGDPAATCAPRPGVDHWPIPALGAGRQRVPAGRAAAPHGDGHAVAVLPCPGDVRRSVLTPPAAGVEAASAYRTVREPVRSSGPIVKG